MKIDNIIHKGVGKLPSAQYFCWAVVAMTS